MTGLNCCYCAKHACSKGEMKQAPGNCPGIKDILGLCVGHDTLFIKHANVPVTVLAVKDRVLGHNPLAAIYQADAYYKRLYHFFD